MGGGEFLRAASSRRRFVRPRFCLKNISALRRFLLLFWEAAGRDKWYLGERTAQSVVKVAAERRNVLFDS